MNKQQGKTLFIEFNGRSLTLREWSKETGLPRFTIRSRIKDLGWTVEKALTRPRMAPTPKGRKGDGYTANGYRLIGSSQEHRLIVERVTGIKLRPEHEVHHANHKRSDNRNENLVLCPNHAYHSLLHAREKALDACGNANWKKCRYCFTYDDPFRMNESGGRFYHAACSAGKSRMNRRK